MTLLQIEGVHEVVERIGRAHPVADVDGEPPFGALLNQSISRTVGETGRMSQDRLSVLNHPPYQFWKTCPAFSPCCRVNLRWKSGSFSYVARIISGPACILGST